MPEIFSEYDRRQRDIRKAEKARAKAMAKGHPKCMPWKHQWTTITVYGLSTSFLDRCDRCLWWREWGVIGGGNWEQLSPPPQYQEEYEHYLKTREKPVRWWHRIFGRQKSE